MTLFKPKNYITNYANKSIKKLVHKYRNENSLSESTFIKELGDFNLKDALICIANVSRKIYIESANIMERTFFITEETTNSHINTNNLAKLVSYFFQSNANDYKREKISTNADANITALNGLIAFHLKDPAYDIMYLNPYNILFILFSEQIKFQSPIYHYYARTLIIFEELLNDDNFKARLKKENVALPKEIDVIFYNNVGLTIRQYLEIGLIFILFFQEKNPNFNLNDFGFCIEDNKDTSIEDIKKFIDFLATDYESFKKLYSQNNLLNPLNINPIIKFQDLRQCNYTIPNINLFLEKIYNGIFYDFERFYLKLGKDELEKFRKLFGFLFEEYIGKLLYFTFGDDKVSGEITYIKKSEFKFFDWIVELDDKFLLIEVKSLGLPQQDIYGKKIDEVVKARLVKFLKSIHNKLGDIHVCDELKKCKTKPVYPILVLKDVSLANSTLMRSIIKQMEIDDSDFKKFLSDYKFIITDLNDFESLLECFSEIDLQHLFAEIEEHFNDGFIPILKRCSNRKDGLLHKMLTEKSDKEFKIIANKYKH